MCDVLQQPYLNADLYLAHQETDKQFENLEFILIYKDGSTFVGASDLTGRIWNGMFQVASSPEEFHAKNTVPKIITQSGLTNGCIPKPETLLVSDDSGSLSLWSKKITWDDVAGPGANAPKWVSTANVCEHSSGILGLDLFPSNSSMAVTGSADNCIKLWDLAEMKSLSCYRPAHSDAVSDVACNPTLDNTFLSSSWDGSVALWHTKDGGRKNKVFLSSKCAARCVCWISENIFATGYEDGKISLFSTETSESLLFSTTASHPVHKMIYSDSSKMLAVCCDSTKVYVYKLTESHKLSLVYEDTKHTEFVRGLAWDLSGGLYTCGWDGIIIKHTIIHK